MKKVMSLALGTLLLLGSLGTGWGATPTVTLLGTLSGNLRAPGKLSLDAAGNLYVADVQKRGVVKFDANARYQGVIGASGVVRSVTSLPDGRLLVSHDRKVTFYGINGLPQGDLAGYTFKEPNGIALDAAGNIYVADSKADRIAVFSASGAFKSTFGTTGSKQGQLNYPTALSYEKEGKLIAVADTLNNRIVLFDTDGTFKRSVGGPSSLSGPLSFTYPDGVAFDYASGVRMYVADGFQNSVQVIDLEAQPKFVGYLGAYGAEEGQFLQLTDVVYDQQNKRMITADSTGVVTYFAVGTDESADNTRLSGLTPAVSGTVAGSGGIPGSTGTAGSTAGSGSGVGGGSSASAGSGSGSTRTSNASWQYPSGVDCRHGKAGSLACR